VPPLVFALPEEILGAGKGPLGFGVLGMFTNIGFALGPTLVGITLDVSSSFTYSFFTLALFVAIALVSLLQLRTR